MSDYAPTPVEDFLDPTIRRSSPASRQTRWNTWRRSAPIDRSHCGDLVFEHGQRETPCTSIVSGALDIIDQAPEGDRYFTQCREGTFAADISMFTGEPTLAAGFAAEPTSLVALPPEDLRRVVATTAELGDLLLRTMVTRREWLQGRGLGQQRLIGSRWSNEACPRGSWSATSCRSWHDLGTDEESRALLDGLGIGDSGVPRPGPFRQRHPASDGDVGCRRARPPSRRSTARPSTSSCSAAVRPGWRRRSPPPPRVSARSWSNAFAPGGQAGTSARIENYLGFPTGLTGAELTRRATLQARKFGAVISSVHEASHVSERAGGLARDRACRRSARRRGRCVVLAPGATIDDTAENADRFEGLGLYYAATHIEAQQCSEEDVVVVGGETRPARPSSSSPTTRASPRRGPATARSGDVALLGRSDQRGQAKRPRLVGVQYEHWRTTSSRPW